MKFQQRLQQLKQQAWPAARATARFLKEVFSDKKNLLRFSLAVVALIVTAQLLPVGKIVYAGLGMTSFMILSYIAMMISAPYALAKSKLLLTVYSLTAYYWVAGTLLLLLYDWIFWYFETAGVLWVLFYCAIIAIFNGIIENLMNDELH